ncbi:helix-turn-helix transcriptional regulator [Chamaesiphon sp. OTE_75_metabat_556]|uniref:helix-turn-helix domain-containing protein n=1 Tax=Chamaesiphon sp. OTE_75_metabat_556 TaxID=2964692 RepID=UPI00286C37BA|nr:helix-turn-helix transcriptional regulator [Chamaesiphon sp. OTE_75_metabat_556]
MTSFLPVLFQEIDLVKTEADLRSQIVPQIREHFVTTKAGIFFFDKLSTLNPSLQNILKIALSIDRNPLARYLVEHHAPVHEGLVTSPKVWSAICPRADHWHVMVGPIVSRGKLVGAVGCTREKSLPAFDSQNLTDLSGICLHLSIWATTVRTTTPIFQTEKLTPRELEIVKLVALGRTNAEIGQELWITENSVKQALKRMFRKLEVSSRTEMVAQLAS